MSKLDTSSLHRALFGGTPEELRQQDIERAEKLRRSRNLPGRKPGTGPRIAR